MKFGHSVDDMKPCDNCKSKDTCSVVDFIKRNIQKSPWELDSQLYQQYAGVSIVTAMTGSLDSVVLECGNYKPVKEEADYSHLTRMNDTNGRPLATPKSKCGRCKGKCDG